MFVGLLGFSVRRSGKEGKSSPDPPAQSLGYCAVEGPVESEVRAKKYVKHQMI